MYKKVVTHGETKKLYNKNPMVVVGHSTIYEPITLNTFLFFFMGMSKRKIPYHNLICPLCSGSSGVQREEFLWMG